MSLSSALVSLIKAPSVPASASTGYVVRLPGTHEDTLWNVQSVQNARVSPSVMFLHVHETTTHERHAIAYSAGRALPLHHD